MDYKEIIEKIKPEVDKTIDFLQREMAKIHTGRPSISLIEDIEVECFGQTFPLKQLGSISSSGPRELVVQPWDKSYLEAIEKALSRSGKGLTPVVAGEIIRISFPPLSQEYRQELLKTILEKKEAARQTIRHWRDEAWGEVQEKERAGEIREDDKYRAKDELQELVDEHNEKIDKMVEAKKKEIET